MARQNITEKIWYDPEATNTIMLDVTKDVVPLSSMIVDGVELLPKDEYHCSLVAAGKLSDDPTVVLKIIRDVEDYLTFTPDSVRFDELTGQYYLCKKDDEMTLIAEARVLGLVGLRKIVQQTIPDYQSPFPHVTMLKSENTKYGIGIYSPEYLKRYCKRMKI